MSLFRRHPRPADDLGLGIAGTLLIWFLSCLLLGFILAWFLLPYLLF